MISDLFRKLFTVGGMEKDPVCGMKVDPKRTKLHSVYKGRHYLFCSEECKKMFEDNPDKYAL